MLFAHLIVAGMIAVVESSRPVSQRFSNTSDQSWGQIRESQEILWQPCFYNYTCTRLVVPLDYSDPSVGTTVISYIKQAAQGNATTAEDVLINPGGPGESGIEAVLSLGSMLASIMPTYNIIGFDPRGVKNSGPRLSCFDEDEESQAIEKDYSTQFIRTIDGKSESSLRYQYEASTAFGKWCTRSNENTTAKYAGTVAVAQDMLNYIEKAANLRGRNPKNAKLNYYGVSYGTVLGSTFASLFPSRLGKFVLDGVANVPEYYMGNWSSNLQNADKALNDFFRFCHSAGQSKCALANTTADAIAKRTKSILESIRKSPVPVYDDAVVQHPVLIRYQEVIFILLQAMYSPLANWHTLAQILVDIEGRNGTSTAKYLTKVPLTMEGNTPLIGSLDSVRYNRKNFDTYEKWTAHLRRMTKDSEWFADAWAPLGLSAKSLEILPPPSQQFNDTSFGVRTNAPILFVSNTHDPSTPLSGALKMHSLFPGSGLLIQEAPGHIASLSAISTCTLGYISQYFVTGELPPANTTCSVESVPFVTESM